MRHLIRAIKILSVEYDEEYGSDPEYYKNKPRIEVPVNKLLFSTINPILDVAVDEIIEFLDSGMYLPPIAVRDFEVEDEDEVEQFKEDFMLVENGELVELETPGDYFVIEDGHHRAMAYSKLGIPVIDAVELSRPFAF